MSTKRDRHPALYPRRMTCQWINQITQTDHGSYLVNFRNIFDNTDQTKDCKVLTKICLTDENKNIEFSFEEYFTEENLAELHQAFLNGEYDDLGDLPEL